MIIFYILIGILNVGKIDRINDGIATIEYINNNEAYYIYIELKGSDCTPRESDFVLFSQNKIISCMRKNEEIKKESVHRRILRKR